MKQSHVMVTDPPADAVQYHVSADAATTLRRRSAAIALIAAAATLVGLAIGMDILTRWIPSSTSMNPVTAAMLLLGATTMFLRDRWQARMAKVSAAVMIAVGAAKIWQIALDHPLGFDQQIAGWLVGPSAALPDPIAPNSAATLILLGIALMLGRTHHHIRAIAAQTLCAVTLVVVSLALIGFVLGAATINQLTFNHMPVNAVVGLGALSVSIMSLTPGHGMMRLLLNDGRAGQLARKSLPFCVLAPLLLGIVRVIVGEKYHFTVGDGVAIMITGSVALSLGLLWVCLTLLLRSDSELRANAQAIATSEDQYRLASQIGKMGHWRYHAATGAIEWSAQFRSILRFGADVVPNFDLMSERIHPDDREQAKQYMAQALANADGWNWSIRLLQSDGSIQYLKSHGICTRRPDGKLDSLFGVLADITELELARQGAEAASLAQAAFLANMSHEIRTPLNGVLGFIALLLDSELDSTQRRYLVLVDESARMLLKLLNDILDLSKVEAGQLDMAPSATDLRQTVRHALRLMAPLAEQKSIKLKSNIDSAFPEAVMIDGARFRQILLNILGNALKFTEHGSVAVSLKADHDANGQPELRAIVSDSGIGIASDRLEAMFKPFVQADSSTSRKFGGSGLGLSISRQLAELMGGTLTLASIEGAGTNVELVLPLHLATISDAVGHESSGSLAGGGVEGIGEIIAAARARPARSILLVEDLELNRMLVGDMLARLGHRVEFAHNGAEALTMAKRLVVDPAAWDLILMDVQMPVMNGNDATRAIRALGGVAATIPIIALSANAFETEIRLSRESGMNDHVVKPIDFGLLSRTIDHWGQSTEPPTATRRRA